MTLEYSVNVMGFNHYVLSDINAYSNETATHRAGFLLQTEHCIETLSRINNSDTNAGGWGNSTLRGIFYSLLNNVMDEKWRDVIKAVERTVGIGNNSASTENVSDKLFVPTEQEIFGSVTYSPPDESSVQYKYYKDGNTRIKQVNGSVFTYWTCSPCLSGATDFCVVKQDGTPEHVSASSELGTAPCFCI